MIAIHEEKASTVHKGRKGTLYRSIIDVILNRDDMEIVKVSNSEARPELHEYPGMHDLIILRCYPNFRITKGFLNTRRKKEVSRLWDVASEFREIPEVGEPAAANFGVLLYERNCENMPAYFENPDGTIEMTQNPDGSFKLPTLEARDSVLILDERFTSLYMPKGLIFIVNGNGSNGNGSNGNGSNGNHKHCAEMMAKDSSAFCDSDLYSDFMKNLTKNN